MLSKLLKIHSLPKHLNIWFKSLHKMKESTWSPKGAFKVSNNSRSIRLRERRLCSPLLGLSFLMMIRESFFRKSIRSWTQMEMESSDQRKFNWVSVKFLENRFLFEKLNRS